jgi:hypothetical protein
VIKNKKISLIRIKRPEQEFVILETTNKERNSSSAIHVISFQAKQSIRLGRSKEADIRI